MTTDDPTQGDRALVRAGTPASTVAQELTNVVTFGCDAFVAAHAPQWRLPHAFAGHAVGADVRADAIFTIGHLAANGVHDVGGLASDDALRTLLGPVDGAATNTFFSYRIAETLLEYGPFDGNPLLASFDDATRHEIALACDSSAFVTWFDEGKLPRNYAAVLARCELARLRLGLTDDNTVFESLVDRLRTVLGSNPWYHLDDSNDAAGRFDIYTADVWLFCEPLAPWLGDTWHDGLATALDLVERTATPDGSAIPWGRSTGILSIALTTELAAAAIHHGIGDASQWLRRALDATRSLPRAFGADGVSDAHRHRDQDAYRGPARRLQLTFDLYGKFAWAARVLATAGDVVAATGTETYAPLDDVVRFAPNSTAAAWTHRRPGLAFTMPFVGAARSHYGPAPCAPGSFEVPVDRPLTPWAPLATGPFTHHVGAGLPSTLDHHDGRVTATWSRFVSTTDTFGAPVPPVDGSRSSTIAVDGRSIVLDDHVSLTDPAPLLYMFPEVPGRPLVIEATA